MLIPLHRCAVKQTVHRVSHLQLNCNITPKLLRRCSIYALANASNSAAAAAPEHAAVPALVQSGDSWRLISTVKQPPRLLLIDGTNLACICAGSKHSRHSILKQPVAERFAAWIDFLQAVTAADAIVVAFDNKGSAEANVRAQLAPKYLNKRYRNPKQQGGRVPGASLDGWAHLGAALQDKACRCFVVEAAYGYEGDDVLAAAAQWVAASLQPRPHVVLVSSDHDMQQLLDSHTYWLQLLQVPSRQFPSGLQLHSHHSFVGHHSFLPGAYPAFLSLVGKPDASIPGVGVSAKLAKTLLASFGSLAAILTAGESGGLKPFGVADKLLGSGPNAVANRQAAAANLAVLSLHAQQQVLPEQKLWLGYEAAVAAWQDKQQQQLTQNQQQQPQQQQQQQQTAAQQQLQSAAIVAALHPAIQAQMRQCRPYLEQLSCSLTSLGVQHRVGWLSPGGQWCHVVAKLYSSSSSSRTEGSLQDTEFHPKPSSGQWLVIQVLGPADLLNGPQAAGGLCSSYEDAAQLLAQQLRSNCGCYVQGTSAMGHAKRSLMSFASGSAKRQLSLLKSAGWVVAVVPFFEFELTGDDAQRSNGSTVQNYVAAVLQEHGGEMIVDLGNAGLG